MTGDYLSYLILSQHQKYFEPSSRRKVILRHYLLGYSPSQSMEAHHISHGKHHTLQIQHTILTYALRFSPVLDLPQLYTKPSAAVLLQALDLLELRPRDFSSKEGDDDNDDDEDGHLSLNPVDVTGYLTSIVSSSLSWLENDDLRDEVWSAASLRICERSGRSGMWIESFQGGLPALREKKMFFDK